VGVTETVLTCAVFAALLCASAACSAAETSLFSLSHADRQLLGQRAPSTAARVERLLREPRALLITILLMNVAVNTSIFMLASVVGARVSDAAAGVIGLATLLATILLGEVVPKTLAVANRMAFARVLSPVILLAGRLIRPVRLVAENFVIAPLSRLVVPARPVVSEAQAAAAATRELSELLESQAEQGVLDPTERRLLSDVLRLRSLRVRDVMTPRQDIVWLSAGDSGEELLAACRTHGHSRYPLSSLRDERVVAGVLRTQDVLPAIGASKDPKAVSLQAFAREACFVPERARLDQLLDRFRALGAEVAMCVDELGNVTGMVQIDDVVRELGVGPADSDAPERQVRLVALNTWEAPGRMSLRHLEDFLAALRVPFPREAQDADVGTLSGMVSQRLGRIPRVGDDAAFPGFRLVVQSVSGRSVARVWIIVVDGQAAAGGGSNGGGSSGGASSGAVADGARDGGGGGGGGGRGGGGAGE
jgi:CBS domain containing-hemolysin-like protein